MIVVSYVSHGFITVLYSRCWCWRTLDFQIFHLTVIFDDGWAAVLKLRRWSDASSPLHVKEMMENIKCMWNGRNSICNCHLAKIIIWNYPGKWLLKLMYEWLQSLPSSFLWSVWREDCDEKSSHFALHIIGEVTNIFIQLLCFYRHL